MKQLVICNSPEEGQAFRRKAIYMGTWVEGSILIYTPDHLRGVRVWEYATAETPLAYASRHYVHIKEELFFRRKQGKRAVHLESAIGGVSD